MSFNSTCSIIYIYATDFIGLKILLKPGSEGASQAEGIFGCYPIKNYVSLNSEVPSSNRMLQHGYMIDDLLTKYQGINFSKLRRWIEDTKKQSRSIW